MKKKISLKVIIPLGAVVISASFIALSIFTSYYAFKNKIEEYYRDRVEHAGETISDTIDPEAVQRVKDVLETDEYYSLWLDYSATADEAPLVEYLTEKQVYGDYKDLMDFVARMRDDLGVIYSYIIDVQSTCTYYILDPDEGFDVAGWRPENTQEFRQYTANVKISPTIATSMFGWLMSGYEPIYNAAGEAIALVGVDYSMDQILSELDDFVKRLTWIMLLLMAVFLVLVIILVSKRIIRPIEQLKDATEDFLDSENADKAYKKMDFDVRSRSEIGELGASIRKMENDIILYIDNLKDVAAEREKMQAELDVASGIQRTLLPLPLTGRKEIDIYAYMKPAREVGGDFYDFFMIDDKRLAFVIADVSGKGVPASLFMVVCKTLIENYTETGVSLGRTFEKINQRICRSNDDGMFITAFEGILDLESGTLEYVNAGHQQPLICTKDGGFKEIRSKTSLVLGGIVNTHYISESIKLQPGDKIYAFTDGVTDSEKDPENFYGMERLLADLDELRAESPENIVNGIRGKIDDFVGGEDQFDDITMLCFEYKGNKD